MTPSYLMFGRNTEILVNISNTITTSIYKDDLKEWKIQINYLQEIWVNNHKESWKKVKEFPIDIRPGEWVLRRRTVDKRGSKSPWETPFQIMETNK
uniref:Uncharacterized protein n=1 Tax=Strongyloides papillosus TaxID=174720 RepID=A0A0N5BBJ1_STREA